MTRAFPEKCLYLGSGDDARMIRLTASRQVGAMFGGAMLVGWTIVASAFFVTDSIGSDQADLSVREQVLYESRLNALSGERDAALDQADAAYRRFNDAVAQVSDMQSALLDAETRAEELSRGLAETHADLRTAIVTRDAAATEAERLAAMMEGDAEAVTDLARMQDVQATLDVLTTALASATGQRDALAVEALEAEAFAEEMILEARLADDRNQRIFTQLEDAIAVSVAPLDDMFESAGLDSASLLDKVRSAHSGTGGPLTPIRLSTKGGPPDAVSLRANSILEKLDRMNLYRIASQKTPFALPIQSSFRFTSGFGPRWGRSHNGTDFAAAHGTPINTTADGVVSFAGRQSGYGNLVKIKHEFGIETRYAHLSSIDVKVGERVSRGDRIGGMGNTGRSTGTHLHYEVRIDGQPVDPMTYIKAAQDVF